MCLCMSIYLSICLSVCLSICLSIYLSIYLKDNIYLHEHLQISTMYIMCMYQSLPVYIYDIYIYMYTYCIYIVYIYILYIYIDIVYEISCAYHFVSSFRQVSIFYDAKSPQSHQAMTLASSGVFCLESSDAKHRATGWEPQLINGNFRTLTWRYCTI